MQYINYILKIAGVYK